jgi:hypothetical protein
VVVDVEDVVVLDVVPELAVVVDVEGEATVAFVVLLFIPPSKIHPVIFSNNEIKIIAEKSLMICLFVTYTTSFF